MGSAEVAHRILQRFVSRRPSAVAVQANRAPLVSQLVVRLSATPSGGLREAASGTGVRARRHLPCAVSQPVVQPGWIDCSLGILVAVAGPVEPGHSRLPVTRRARPIEELRLLECVLHRFRGGEGPGTLELRRAEQPFEVHVRGRAAADALGLCGWARGRLRPLPGAPHWGGSRQRILRGGRDGRWICVSVGQAASRGHPLTCRAPRALAPASAAARHPLACGAVRVPPSCALLAVAVAVVPPSSGPGADGSSS
jgi:hypothetical protein